MLLLLTTMASLLSNWHQVGQALYNCKSGHCSSRENSVTLGFRCPRTHLSSVISESLIPRPDARHSGQLWLERHTKLKSPCVLLGCSASALGESCISTSAVCKEHLRKTPGKWICRTIPVQKHMKSMHPRELQKVYENGHFGQSLRYTYLFIPSFVHGYFDAPRVCRTRHLPLILSRSSVTLLLSTEGRPAAALSWALSLSIKSACTTLKEDSQLRFSFLHFFLVKEEISNKFQDNRLQRQCAFPMRFLMVSSLPQ